MPGKMKMKKKVTKQNDKTKYENSTVNKMCESTFF